MTSDLPSALEVCFKRDALNKSMFTLLYFTLPIPQQTPLTIPNGIRIHSAVFPQYTFWSDRQTHRWDRRQVYTISAYARCIDRKRRANNVDQGDRENKILAQFVGKRY